MLTQGEMEEMREKYKKNLAAGEPDFVIEPHPHSQEGYIIVQCPRCTIMFALTDPGRHRHLCGALLEVKPPEKK